MTTAIKFPSSAWMDHPGRRCRNQPSEVFFPVVLLPNGEVDEDADEPPWPSPQASRLCEHCPVADDCRQWALLTEQPSGIWGGLSAYQRELVLKPRSRRSCPGCDAPDVVTERGNEVCLACGLSWEAL